MMTIMEQASRIVLGIDECPADLKEDAQQEAALALLEHRNLAAAQKAVEDFLAGYARIRKNETRKDARILFHEQKRAW